MIRYIDIFKLSMPIMIGSAVQNIITLTDAFFLGRVGQTEFAAIGLVGIFYLMITTIGYNFSKAGQIMIARRVGEGDFRAIGKITHNMMAFALFLALLMFLGMQYLAPSMFEYFIEKPNILAACKEYLYARSYGVFFSYIGVTMVALYTGVARTSIIIYNSVVLGTLNALLNHALIFGNFGFPQLGMAGAAWASTLSEVAAFVVFLLYVVKDREARTYGLFKMPSVDFALIKSQIALSLPIVFQSVVGVGSWQVFFFIIEDMDADGTALAVSNLIRTVYLVLMIPCWGFSSGINTIVSNLIGKNQQDLVLKSIHKTAILCFVVTMVCASMLFIAPEFVLQIGTDDAALIQQSQALFGVLVLILISFSVGAVYFNGMVGTGATQQSLWLQTGCCIFYLAYIVVSVEWFDVSLSVAWLAEFWYWGATLLLALWYLRSGRWRAIQV